MKTDYKIWYVRRDDDVHIDEVAVKFYEGEITTEVGYDENYQLVNKTQYRRTGKLKKKDLAHFQGKQTKFDAKGGETILFTKDDFGIISTDDEIKVFLNNELVKDTSREAVLKR